jgi:hypothetical protein
MIRLAKMTVSNDASRLESTRESHSRSTVKRAYSNWRKQQDIRDRCDMPDCQFGSAPLVWNGERLTLILDHINGVNTDDRPENLRYLCPNCNSQLATHGGGNKGRIQKSNGGFAIRRDDGRRDYTLVAGSGKYELRQEPATIVTCILDSADSPSGETKER